MVKSLLTNIEIKGIACAVPTTKQNINDFSEEVGEQEVKKFIKTTGIKQSYIRHKKQTTSDLCYVAAEEIIKEKKIDRNQINALIFLTQSPDYLIPATSHILHKRLNLSKDCMVFDINLGCSGYVYGLYIAATLLKTENINNVLFLAGDVFRDTSKGDIKNRMLFGDAGTATLISRGEGNFNTLLKADGEGYPAIITPGGALRNPVEHESEFFDKTALELDGAAVFEFTITEVPKVIKEFLDVYDRTLDDYHYCIFHQANEFMLKHIAKKIKLPLDKMPLSIDRYGNTSSASIPLTIVDLCAQDNVPEILKLLTSGFGIGLSWGVVDFSVDKGNVLPIIYTDDYYEEAYFGKKEL